MSQGTILIIGGGGKTGARVNARLSARHRHTTGLAFHRNAFRNEFGDQVQFGVVQAEGIQINRGSMSGGKEDLRRAALRH